MISRDILHSIATIRERSPLPIVMGIALFIFQCTSVAASEVVILSSDESVERYREASKAFSSHFPSTIKVEDLGKLKRSGLRALRKRVKISKPDLLYAIGAKALKFALKELKETPMLFSSVLNWKRFDYHNRNILGVASEVSTNTQLTLYKYVFPSIKTIGLIYNPKYNREWFETAKKEAESLGITLLGVEFRPADTIENKLKTLVKKIDAFWLISDPVVITMESTPLIFSQLDKARKPIFSYRDFFIESGATIAVSIKSPAIGKQAASLAKSFLSGKEVSRKIRLPEGKSITLNLYQVKKYNLTFNRDSLGSINNIVNEKADVTNIPGFN